MAVGYRQRRGRGHGHAVAQGRLGETLGVDVTQAHPEGQAAGRLGEAPPAQPVGQGGGEHLVAAAELDRADPPGLGPVRQQALGQQLADGRRPQVVGGLDPGEAQGQGLGGPHESESEPTPQDLAQRADDGHRRLGAESGDGWRSRCPAQVGQGQVLHQRDAVAADELGHASTPVRREDGTGGALHGGLQEDEGGPGGQGVLELVTAHTVVIHGNADETGTGLSEGGDGPRVAGVLDDHAVAGPQPAGGGGADSLLGAGRDHDLAGRGGKSPARHMVGDQGPQDRRTPGAVPGLGRHGPQVAAGQGHGRQPAGIVEDRDRQIDDRRVAAAALHQTVHQGRSLPPVGKTQ